MSKILDNGVLRDMNEAELAQLAQDAKAAQEEQAAIEAQIASKESAKAKLAALGLTDDEINAIIGGV